MFLAPSKGIVVHDTPDGITCRTTSLKEARKIAAQLRHVNRDIEDMKEEVCGVAGTLHVCIYRRQRKASEHVVGNACCDCTHVLVLHAESSKKTGTGKGEITWSRAYHL